MGYPCCIPLGGRECKILLPTTNPSCTGATVTLLDNPATPARLTLYFTKNLILYYTSKPHNFIVPFPVALSPLTSQSTYGFLLDSKFPRRNTRILYYNMYSAQNRVSLIALHVVNRSTGGIPYRILIWQKMCWFLKNNN